MRANLIFAVGVMGKEEDIKAFMEDLTERLDRESTSMQYSYHVQVISAKEAIEDDDEVH